MSSLLVQGNGIEFGWLVASYIPAVRHIAQKYDKVTVICPISHRYLWEDFATDFINLEIKGECDRWYCDGKIVGISPKYLSYGTDKIWPKKSICTKAKRKYFKYGNWKKTLRIDLVIHARQEIKFGRKKRNLNLIKYVKLLKMLRKNKAISACSIGTKKGAHHIPGTQDLRDLALDELCDVLASCKLMISVSSGPAHLASLCGASLLVWTDDKYQQAIGGTNRDRYCYLWNPYKSPVKVIDKHGWRPKVETIYNAVRKMV